MMSSSLPRLGQSFTSPQSPRSIDEQQQIPRRHRSSLSIAEVSTLCSQSEVQELK
jgi:hypothetical protein